MRYCPNDDCPFIRNCGARSTYEDHVERCLDCGTPLASGEPTDPPGVRAPEVKLVVLGSYEPDEANSILHLLKSQGLPVYCHGEYLSHEFPEGTEGPIELQVRPQDEDDARELFLELEQVADDVPDVDETADEACPKCGGTEFGEREEASRGWLSFLTGTKKTRFCRGCGATL